MYYATRKIIRSVVEAVMPDNNASLMEIIFTQRKLTRGPAITVATKIQAFLLLFSETETFEGNDK